MTNAQMKAAAEQIKFKLEFMVFMIATDRREEASDTLGQIMMILSDMTKTPDVVR